MPLRTKQHILLFHLQMTMPGIHTSIRGTACFTTAVISSHRIVSFYCDFSSSTLSLGFHCSAVCFSHRRLPSCHQQPDRFPDRTLYRFRPRLVQRCQRCQSERQQNRFSLSNALIQPLFLATPHSRPSSAWSHNFPIEPGELLERPG